MRLGGLGSLEPNLLLDSVIVKWRGRKGEAVGSSSEVDMSWEAVHMLFGTRRKCAFASHWLECIMHITAQAHWGTPTVDFNICPMHTHVLQGPCCISGTVEVFAQVVGLAGGSRRPRTSSPSCGDTIVRGGPHGQPFGP